MKKLEDIKRSDYSVYVLFDGIDKKIPVLGVPSMAFDAKVDIESGCYITNGEPEYKSCEWPTINDLIKQGKAISGSYLYTYDVDPVGYENRFNCPEPDYSAWMKEFAEHGFLVSRTALEHNFKAWMMDYKSGYRGKDYHLFTPCGCNPLSFRATSLDKMCKEWQTTYEW